MKIIELILLLCLIYFGYKAMKSLLECIGSVFVVILILGILNAMITNM